MEEDKKHTDLLDYTIRQLHCFLNRDKAAQTDTHRQDINAALNYLSHLNRHPCVRGIRECCFQRLVPELFVLLEAVPEWTDEHTHAAIVAGGLPLDFFDEYMKV